jgi:hypothetical protein
MNSLKVVIASAVIALASGAVHAADEQKAPEAQGRQASNAQITGFGSGTGMGPGGGFGSPTSVVDSIASPTSGNGSQSFGGGFDRGQSPNSGPLATNRGGNANNTPGNAQPGQGANASNPNSGSYPVLTTPSGNAGAR